MRGSLRATHWPGVTGALHSTNCPAATATAHLPPAAQPSSKGSALELAVQRQSGLGLGLGFMHHHSLQPQDQASVCVFLLCMSRDLEMGFLQNNFVIFYSVEATSQTHGPPCVGCECGTIWLDYIQGKLKGLSPQSLWSYHRFPSFLFQLLFCFACFVCFVWFCLFFSKCQQKK